MWMCSPGFLLFLQLMFQLFLCCCLSSGMDNSVSSNSILGCSQKMYSAILYFVLTPSGVFFTFKTVKLFCTLRFVLSWLLICFPYGPYCPVFVLGNLHKMCPLMGASKIYLVKLLVYQHKNLFRVLKTWKTHVTASVQDAQDCVIRAPRTALQIGESAQIKLELAPSLPSPWTNPRSDYFWSNCEVSYIFLIEITRSGL